MDTEQLRMRTNVQGDRLSCLPDELVHKILSFVDIRVAIGTSALSSRWRYIWTSMPYLTISADDFPTMPKFSEFATNILSRRNNLTEVYSLKLSFRVRASFALVEKILEYAFSHNIQQLDVVCVLENDIEFPLSLFNSQSLKHLTFTMQPKRSQVLSHRSLISTWELPALTTLVLNSVILCVDGDDKCVDLFSKCKNLKELTINDVLTKGSNYFIIIHPRLSSLTLENSWYIGKDFNVVAPQLKNLTIRRCPGKHAISAPELTSLVYKNSYPLALSTEGFHSLEKADIYISCPGGRDKDARKIISMLQLLHNVHFLTLNLKIVEFLSSTSDLILPHPSPFVNLKSLNIHPENLRWDQAPKEVTFMSTKVKSYLLDSSPGSTFTMFLREEIKAQKMMAELGVILEKEKDYIMTNMAHVEQGKVHVESNKAKAKTNWKTELIKSSWETLGVQLQQRKDQACLIISKMQDIEEFVTKLPASNRAKIEPCFSSLCAEVDNVIIQITYHMKMQCDENQSLSSVRFHQLATTFKSSSY